MGKRVLLRAVVGFAIYLLFVPALLFISAGTVNWPLAWVYVAFSLSAVVGSRLLAWRRNPDLLRERARFTQAEGTQPWDRVLVGIGALYGPLAMMVVAGLDHRLGWSMSIPVYGQYLAAAAVAVGFGLGVWAMAVNPYFSAVARLQRDRGQVVVTSGPYRLVRHPSYAGGLLATLALPFMLSALWALAPGLVIVAVLVIRTKLEDEMLMDGLEGYRQYAQRTRYRLIPGVW